jgi:hypothetical protein
LIGIEVYAFSCHGIVSQESELHLAGLVMLCSWDSAFPVSGSEQGCAIQLWLPALPLFKFNYNKTADWPSNVSSQNSSFATF